MTETYNPHADAGTLYQSGRFLIGSMTPTVWAKGTGWVNQEVVDEMLLAGFLEAKTVTRGGESVRMVRLSERGLAVRALMGPDGTRGRNER